MTAFIYSGVDPGKNGAIASIDQDGAVGGIDAAESSLAAHAAAFTPRAAPPKPFDADEE